MLPKKKGTVGGAGEITAETDRTFAVAFRRDVGLCAFLHREFPDLV
jgi:hypothetical protein